MNRTWNQGAVIYYAVFNPDNWLMRYFNPVSRWQFLESHDLEIIEKHVEMIYEQGGTAWLDTTATDVLMSEHPDFQAWLDEHTQRQHRHELIYPGYKIRFLQVFPTQTPRKLADQGDSLVPPREDQPVCGHLRQSGDPG